MNPGRNEPCPCGSGEKYKRCCGKPTVASAASLASISAPPLNPTEIAALIDEMAAWMNSGRQADVEARVKVLLERHPTAGPLWKLYAGALMAQNKDSLRAWAQAAALMPSDSDTFFYWGNALLDRSEFGRACECLQQSVRLKPDFAEAHDSLGSALLALGNPADAALSYRQALKVRPTYAEAHGNLGNALMDLGKLEDAVFHYRRMLEFRPTLAEAHNNLGNALLALRRYEEALNTYRRTVELRPDSPGVHANLGNVLRELGRTEEALTHCRRAVELAPNFADGHWLLGNAHFDMGNLDEAAACYRRAMGLAPQSVEPLIALSKVMRQTGKVVEANENCLKALTLNPGSADALALLGELKADQGLFTEAEGLLKRAAAMSPDMPEAWASLTRFRRMSNADSPWLENAQRLLKKTLPVGQEINLRNALGKYLDDLKDFDAAFESYRLANDLKKLTGVKHDQGRVTRRVDAIIRRYDPAWLERTRGAGETSELPVFIVGMPRSGTTLAEQILASHPEVFGAGELRYWHGAQASYEDAVRSGSVNPKAITAAANGYLEQLRALSGAARVVDKMPANFMNLGLIHAALPRARIIHMRRNPMDTGLSIYFQTFSNTHTYANDLSDIAHYFLQYQRLMRHWLNTLPPEAILDVPYEDLIDAPESWIRKMLDHVRLPWNERCLNFHETSRTVTSASNWQVRQKISKSSAGRWRNYEQHLGPLRSLLERSPA